MITFNNYDLIPISKEILTWIKYAHITDTIKFFVNRTDVAAGLMIRRPKLPSKELGRFVWPADASRWATAQYLIHAEDVYKLEKELQASYSSKPLVMSDRPDDSPVLQTEMYMLSAWPVQEIVPNGPENLYILTLVDERYFWYNKTGPENLVVEGITSWAGLLSALATKLGTNIQIGQINPAYLFPAEGFNVSGASLAQLLDVAALSIGHRIIRLLNGTLVSQPYAIGKTNLDNWITHPELHKRAGGKVRTEELSYGNTPSIIEFVFPTSTATWFRIPIQTQHGKGTLTVVSSALAQVENEIVVNQNELQGLAQTWSNDYLISSKADPFYTFNGLIPSFPNSGMVDSITIDSSTKDWKTSVYRGVFNPLISNFLFQASSFGSLYPPPLFGIIPSGEGGATFGPATKKVALVQTYGTQNVAMRRDEGLELDQAISPVWTGLKHDFTRLIGIKPRPEIISLGEENDSYEELDIDIAEYSQVLIQPKGNNKSITSIKAVQVPSGPTTDHTKNGNLLWITNVSTQYSFKLLAFRPSIEGSELIHELVVYPRETILLWHSVESIYPYLPYWRRGDSHHNFDEVLLPISGADVISLAGQNHRVNVIQPNVDTTIHGMYSGAIGQHTRILQGVANRKVKIKHRSSLAARPEEEFDLGPDYEPEDSLELRPNIYYEFVYVNNRWRLYDPFDEDADRSLGGCWEWFHEIAHRPQDILWDQTGDIFSADLSNRAHWIWTGITQTRLFSIKVPITHGSVNTIYGRRKWITNSSSTANLLLMNGSNLDPERIVVPGGTNKILRPNETIELVYIPATSTHTIGSWVVFSSDVPDILDQKGQIISHDGNNYRQVLSGLSNEVLIADAIQPAGIKWGPVEGLLPGYKRLVFVNTISKTVTGSGTFSLVPSDGRLLWGWQTGGGSPGPALIIPGNRLIPGFVIQIHAAGQWGSGSSGSINIRMLINGQIIQTGNFTITRNVANTGWWRMLTNLVCFTTGATGTLSTRWSFEYSSSVTSPAYNMLNRPPTSPTLITIDTTQPISIEPQVQYINAPNDTLTVNTFVVEEG